MRISYLVHGYPPRENAGTEQHTRVLAEAMQKKGHHVSVISATRAPGRRHAERLELNDGVIRIVNNIPARPLEEMERDQSIELAIQNALDISQPDVIHVQHLQFLSSHIELKAKSIFTFHDAWTWCAAGGAELRPNGAICKGPSPESCSRCAPAWQPVQGRITRSLIKAAGRLSPIVPPEKLHALWQRLPAKARSLANRSQKAPTQSSTAAAARNQAFQTLISKMDLRISPSKYLAMRAEAMGMGKVEVIPHGAPKRKKGSGGSGFVFIGTIARHKGPDLVSSAHTAAFGNGGPTLNIYGPLSNPTPSCTHPFMGPLSQQEVLKTLSNADALVMGSIWPENYPMIIVEAKSVGCPIIAPNIGGIPELVEHGVDGWLYEAGNMSDLSKTMCLAWEAPRPRVRPPLSIADQVDRTEALYRRLL